MGNTFTDNSATDGPGVTEGFGGGLYNDGSTATLSSTFDKFMANSAFDGYGGGLFNGGGTATLTLRHLHRQRRFRRRRPLQRRARRR